jgi:hypothetical protein
MKQQAAAVHQKWVQAAQEIRQVETDQLHQLLAHQLLMQAAAAEANFHQAIQQAAQAEVVLAVVARLHLSMAQKIEAAAQAAADLVLLLMEPMADPELLLFVIQTQTQIYHLSEEH